MNVINSAITVTPTAVAYIRKCLVKRGGGIGLRLHVDEAGCSGYKYAVDYVDVATAMDKVFPLDEALAIYIDKKVYPLVKGLLIDYQQEGLNGKLVFENPNQTGSCGCGESFAVD